MTAPGIFRISPLNTHYRIPFPFDRGTNKISLTLFEFYILKKRSFGKIYGFDTAAIVSAAIFTVLEGGIFTVFGEPAVPSGYIFQSDDSRSSILVFAFLFSKNML